MLTLSSGESVAGLNSEAAAQKLRGRIGTTVTVKLLGVISISFMVLFDFVIKSTIYVKLSYNIVC